MAASQVRRDWKGWSHSKLRLQLLLIGRFLVLQDCQHSSAGVIRFSKGHITLCRENCSTLVFGSEYRRGNEVVYSKNDENKPFPSKTYYLVFTEEATNHVMFPKSIFFLGNTDFHFIMTELSLTLTHRRHDEEENSLNHNATDIYIYAQ